jgi:stage III sporulation protein AE
LYRKCTVLKKKAKTAAMTAAALFLLAGSASAALPDAGEELSRVIDTQAVEEAAGLPPEIDLRVSPDLDGALRILYGRLREENKGMLSDALKSAAITVIMSFVCAAAAALGEGVSGPARLAAAAVTAGIFVSAGGGLMAQATEAVGKLEDFSNVLLPTLAAAEAAAGLFTAAAAKYSAAALFFNILTNLISRLLTPTVFVFIAASVGEAVTGSRALSGAASLIKYAAIMTLTALLLAFTLYISVSGFTASAADASAVKAAKTAISTMMPLAGSIASDAASAVMSAAAAIKNSVGAFGMLAVIFMSAGPFLNTGARYLIYKCASALTAEVGDGTAAKLTGRFADACGIMTSAIGAAALMRFISVFSFMGAMTA